MLNNTAMPVHTDPCAATTAALSPPLSAAERAQALEFMRAEFSRHFGVTTEVTDRMDPPHLLILRDEEGRVAGALGLRTCTEGWFSTRYLNQPIESLLAAVPAEGIDPLRVIEVVHLTVRGPAVVSPLLDQLAILLVEAGFTHALCTVTWCLQRLFERRGWAVSVLAEANPAALGDAAPAWGRYYEQQPRVVLGDLRAAARIAALRGNAGALR